MDDELSMREGIIELYEILGDNTGITFLHEDLPGIIVTIGFTKEEDNNETTGNSTGSDGAATGGAGTVH